MVSVVPQIGGLVSHSWVGAGVGAAVGAVGGDLIERSNQPDYVAHHNYNHSMPAQHTDQYKFGRLSKLVI